MERLDVLFFEGKWKYDTSYRKIYEMATSVGKKNRSLKGSG